MSRPEKLLKMMGGLGYGSRREVERLFIEERVTDIDGERLYGDDRVEHSRVLLDGKPLDPAEGSVIVLHKPEGFICSTDDPGGRLIYELLPHRFRHRSPVLASIGRLDKDTSGLLLLTDDGQFLHKVISPKSSVEKLYEADLARPLEGGEIETLASGTLMLKNETKPCVPAKLVPIGEKKVRLVLTEGRYHQARRMLAAVGNHVEKLRRVGIGGITLDGLEEGAWRLLTPEEKKAVFTPLDERLLNVG
ncbi:pseudouridine synthase [Lacibacterium aquatile]|uniref:Pseudouridine synthase n=1 Tax=Lacibacterium aquatile TaxID=1168082 RepID=A0ABW5DUC7_9PROT